MRILATPAAVDHIRARGGRAFVWAISMAYGYQPVFSLEASTDEPAGSHDFVRVEAGSIELLLDTEGRDPPDSVHLDVKGRFRPSLRAYWNGNSFAQGPPGGG